MYKNIVGIIGAPRTGTSWTGQIFDSVPNVLYRMQPFYSWAFRDKINVRSSQKEINQIFQEIYWSNDQYLTQVDRKRRGVYPIFEEKNHNPDIMVFKEVMFHYLMPVIMENIEHLKMIALVRNPVDTLTSFYNIPREFDPKLDIQDEWYFAQTRNKLLPENYFGYHKWKEYVNIITMLEKKYPNRVQVLRYEDLVANTEKVVSELFKFVDIPLTNQTQQFIYDSKHSTVDDPYAVFRNSAERSSKRQLPENIIKAIQVDLENFQIANRFGYH